jgi:hypothetical protein
VLRSRKTRVPRTVGAFAAAVLTVALGAGCTTNDEPEPKGTAGAMEPIAAGIQAQLAGRPDVARAKVVYQDNITAPGSTVVSVVARPGADLNAVLDDSLRLVWTSRLNPLKSINVGVADPQDTTRGVSRLVVTANPDDRAAMEGKYGPRPQ